MAISVCSVYSYLKIKVKEKYVDKTTAIKKKKLYKT